MKKFTDFFDKVYLINLINRDDKRSFMIEQFKKLGIYEELIESNKLEIYDAVKFPFFNSEVVNKINPNLGGNSGLLQCAMSHYTVISRALKEGYERVLILEDDACFYKDLNTVIKILEEAPQDFNILHLEGFYWPDANHPTEDDWRAILSPTIEEGKWLKCGEFKLWATAAILYTRRGMERYIEEQNTYFSCPDLPTLNMENSYFYTYPIVRQEDKNAVSSDSFQYAKNATDYNIYYSKSDRTKYYHIYD